MRGDKNERPSPQASPPAGRGGVYLKNRIKFSNIFGYYINLKFRFRIVTKTQPFIEGAASAAKPSLYMVWLLVRAVTGGASEGYG